MAHGILQNMIEKNKLVGQIEVGSAGTNPLMFGHPYHKSTIKVLAIHGIEFHGRSRTIDYDDLVYFDYILALDNSIKSDLLDLDIRKEFVQKIDCLLSYATKPPSVLDVPDPYYGTFENFEDCYTMIHDACTNLFQKIKK